jgi:DMSO/TMAO reductase YedYZ molybdopterin-dependent catalytic subunit
LSGSDADQEQWGTARQYAAPLVHEDEPRTAETPLALLGEPLTSQGRFYVRNHGPTPALDIGAWQCLVNGEVDRPLALSWSQLRAQAPETRRVTLECAGNGRAYLARPVEGTPWRYGAVGTAEFTGVPLRVVLEQAGVRAEAVEIRFAGADECQPDSNRRSTFQRSLPLEVALQGECLLAWSMNGELLTREHGYPLRLVVPGWYGMASVKWLVRVTALAGRFDGYYQSERYVFRGERGTPEGAPVTRQRVRAVIAHPVDGTTLPRAAAIRIAGTAWSGEAPVERVELSLDGGRSWVQANIDSSLTGAASTWSLTWSPPGAGAYSIMARATDRQGNTQPIQAGWNVYGYANNAVQRVGVLIG